MSAQNKGTAIPVRFEKEEKEFIASLNSATKLTQSDIIRRAVAFACPKFLSGEVNILTFETGFKTEAS